MLRSEMTARAVEQIVCSDFGVECWTVDHAAHIAIMESIKSGLPYAPFKDTVGMIGEIMTSARGRECADRVVALAKTPIAKRNRRADAL